MTLALVVPTVTTLMLARVALLERLSTTSQIIVGVALLLSLGFVIWLLTRRAKG